MLRSAPVRLLWILRVSPVKGSLRNHKLTEFELSYFLSHNMTLNYSNITDFYEEREFQPRLSLKLSYDF